jgi:signal peptidase I
MNNALEKWARSISWIMWFGKGLFFAVIIILILMRSVITVIRVDGHSMDPTLRDGQWVAVDLASNSFKGWDRGDIAILKFPGDPLHSWYVKRVIGLPGDVILIDNGVVTRNGEVLNENYLLPGTLTENGVVDISMQVPTDKYLVLGDNRNISNDSRYFGYVPKSNLYGEVIGYRD